MTTSSPRDQLIVGAGAGPRPCAARAHATVRTIATAPSNGTATRSARATAEGPRQTTRVAITPRTMAHAACDPLAPNRAVVPAARLEADAAMTLLRAIHAKLERYNTNATRPAPRMPSAGRAAITEGTRRCDPMGASAATSAAPAALPARIRRIEARTLKADARLAPTWNVVATTFAPTKIRNRSTLED